MTDLRFLSLRDTLMEMSTIWIFPNVFLISSNLHFRKRAKTSTTYAYPKGIWEQTGRITFWYPFRSTFSEKPSCFGRFDVFWPKGYPYGNARNRDFSKSTPDFIKFGFPREGKNVDNICLPQKDWGADRQDDFLVSFSEHF